MIPQGSAKCRCSIRPRPVHRGVLGCPSPLDRGSLRRGALRLLVEPGKLSRVNLHRLGRDDVQWILADHGPFLSCYRGCLDHCVQEAGGYWEAPSHPDFVSIDPCTRTAHVRALAGAVVSQWPQGGASLRLKVTPFSGLHLYTPDGQRIRTRSRPRDLKTGLSMRMAKDWTLAAPLWGHDPFAQPYELSVLLDIDLGTKTLYMASLVAIDWGTDDKGREIYYEEEIPPPAVAGFDDSGPDGGPGRPGPNSGPSLDDDFIDLLGDGKGVAGSNPA
jgi:hypothetical protein